MKEQSLYEKTLAKIQAEIEMWTDAAASNVNAYGLKFAADKTTDYWLKENLLYEKALVQMQIEMKTMLMEGLHLI